MRFPAALRALNHRDFRRFWLGQSVSVVGSWMQSVGLSWLVLELTGSPLRLGLVSALQFAPVLVLSMLAGVVVDRLPKRRLVIATQIALMLPAFTLGALAATGLVRYWHVAALATVIGVVNAFDLPSRQTIVVEMVGRDDLLNAVALNSASFNAARVAGPALAGALIAWRGTAVAFLLNGLSFLPVVLALLTVRVGRRPRPPAATSVRQEIGAGLRYAARTPRVALVLSLVLAMSLFALNHGVLVPLFARDVLGQDVHGFGLLMASLGVGAVAGAAGVAAFGGGPPPLGAVVGPALLAATGLLGLAFVRHFAVAAAVLFVIGAMQIVFLNGCNTIVQVTVPDDLRGRVVALYAMVFAGVSPFGALMIGSVAEGLGVPAACAAGGGLALGSVLALLLAWRHRAGPGG